MPVSYLFEDTSKVKSVEETTETSENENDKSNAKHHLATTTQEEDIFADHRKSKHSQMWNIDANKIGGHAIQSSKNTRSRRFCGF